MDSARQGGSVLRHPANANVRRPSEGMPCEGSSPPSRSCVVHRWDPHSPSPQAIGPRLQITETALTDGRRIVTDCARRRSGGGPKDCRRGSESVTQLANGSLLVQPRSKSLAGGVWICAHCSIVRRKLESYRHLSSSA